MDLYYTPPRMEEGGGEAPPANLIDQSGLITRYISMTVLAIVKSYKDVNLIQVLQ